MKGVTDGIPRDRSGHCWSCAFRREECCVALALARLRRRRRAYFDLAAGHPGTADCNRITIEMVNSDVLVVASNRLVLKNQS